MGEYIFKVTVLDPTHLPVQALPTPSPHPVAKGAPSGVPHSRFLGEDLQVRVYTTWVSGPPLVGRPGIPGDRSLTSSTDAGTVDSAFYTHQLISFHSVNMFDREYRCAQ